MAASPSTGIAGGPWAQSRADTERVERLFEAYNTILRELGKVIVGQKEVVDLLLMSMFCGGHCLLVGVPGLAKTLMVSTLARLLRLTFRRIQFTPDLMPSDVTGTDILQEDPLDGKRRFEFLPGPIFTNMLLADEINRTPPKTQAALLEGMQERQVTVGRKSMPLPSPFFVLATQNPIEHEGTYPLPEAQLDRFMLSIQVKYPSENEELEIVQRATSPRSVELSPVLEAAEMREIQALVPRIPAGDHVYRFAIGLARSSRPELPGSPEYVRRFVSWGAGPRASEHLMLGAKARALLSGRLHATTDDVEAVAVPVLAHRMVTNFNAESEGVSSASLVKKLLETVPREKSKALE